MQELIKTLEALDTHKRFNKLDFYEPYPKQLEFHNLGLTKRERMLMASNQLGKTLCGGAEAAIHLTGRYPRWWKGRVFTHPVKAWSIGETSTLVRDKPQSILFGQYGVEAARGTGFIPKIDFLDYSLARGVTDAYDTCQVQHYTEKEILSNILPGSRWTKELQDGVSTIGFKSYEQGRKKLQSESLDFWWGDEEPPDEIYGELLARISATDGMGYVTFTPLQGQTEVVLGFLESKNPDKGFVQATIDDALHISAEARAKVVAAYKPHEREARTLGIPMMGEGKIFTVPEEGIIEPPLNYVPEHWAKLWGIDFGIGHAFAAVLILWDKDTDVIHVHHALKMSDALPINHAAAMKPIGADVPVAWPQDGTSREKGTGKPLSDYYKAEGLKMLAHHAKWPDGSLSTEAAVLEMQEREKNGKLKVAAHLNEYFLERRLYHRKDGLIVKLRDDILSATQKAIMMKRFARPVMLGGKRMQRLHTGIAKGTDFDLF